MINISPDQQIRSTLRPGSVYYFTNESFLSDEPHYHIVIKIIDENSEYGNEQFVLMVCCTSQIEKKKDFLTKTKLPPDTLVLIKKEEYEEFSKDTIVDCNYYKCMPLKKVISMLKSNELKIKSHINNTIIDKIKEGLYMSPEVDNYTKDFIK